ncbi:Uma2 family endonuclease [Polyangium sp. 6x1]|uniref:Uma2 family endonuclease n=1 Tax=Polyangium sp. 6x1 TaxID=3042689 RepID=UPI0024830F7F|nr:Uma2 family endonuclease [Polyangium sp. 6x1]MDI1445537.1 Uma2 family endonuclease [Polyangium sp. 6x1]
MGSAAWRLGAEDPDDPTFYPVFDDMGESALQRLMTELLRPLIARFLAERGVQAFVGADQFIYWIKGNAKAVVAPDVYVMPGFPPDVAPRCWKVWQTGVAPSFALEIVAEEDENKDVSQSPQRHDELGTRELVVFDPYVDVRSGRTRFRVHRRDEEKKLVLVEATNADRIRSEVLGCVLRAVGGGDAMRLRLAVDAEGEELFPTEAEAAEGANRKAEIAARKAEEAEREAEEARKAELAARETLDAERVARRNLELELARMRAELERLRR